MASKGQKFIWFTDEERTEIVGQYLSGQGSYKSIAKDRGISWKQLKVWLENIEIQEQLFQNKKVDLKKKI